MVVLAIVAFGLLSAWQWSRADQRRAERVALQTAVATDPAPLASLDLSAEALTGDDWRAVTTMGTYLPDSQVVVRKRPLDARNGFWLMTALRTDPGPVVWVNRGWLPAGQDALSTPDLPAPPAGEVLVTGYLRSLEITGADANDGLPAGQIAAPALNLLPPLPDAIPDYIQLSASRPEQEGLVTLPIPDIDESRNVSYAIQWLLFAAVAIAGWFFFLRREAQEDAERAASPTGADAGRG